MVRQPRDHPVMRTLVGIVVALVACKGDKPTERAIKTSSSEDFWPDAPVATSTGTARRFAYKPDNIVAYRMTAVGGATKRAPEAARFTFDMTLDLAFDRGSAANERAAFIRKLAFKLDGLEDANMTMTLDGKGIEMDQGGEHISFKPGEPGPFDVAGMTEKPFTSLLFDPSGSVKAQTVPDHPFNTVGGDMLNDALVLLPSLPAGELALGGTWTVIHDTTLGGTSAKTTVTYKFTYVGDSACPSGRPACSLMTFSTSSAPVEATEDGQKMRTSYGIAGKVYFDHERGIVDESRSQLEMESTTRGLTVPVQATYTIKPS